MEGERRGAEGTGRVVEGKGRVGEAKGAWEGGTGGVGGWLLDQPAWCVGRWCIPGYHGTVSRNPDHSRMTGQSSCSQNTKCL